ncbi:hypothetical protein O3W44_21890 [Pantoea sp. LMR881]|uniref:hypothetical protein n=1 Tax=Pantoea sp. LMR881 TaxID=3014336 RepID=UPI0022AF2E11|nr:hypothetical protein [Pantoea sp. LMR881]MCZ4061183.1 hypothetical protein [Pantoea sp. LMR881]
MNTVELDLAYKAFLKVRQEWISTLLDFTQYPETEQPEAITRPVALVGGPESGGVKTLEKLKHLQREWQRFYDLAEEYREKKVSPIPKKACITRCRLLRLNVILLWWPLIPVQIQLNGTWKRYSALFRNKST